MKPRKDWPLQTKQMLRWEILIMDFLEKAKSLHIAPIAVGVIRPESKAIVISGQNGRTHRRFLLMRLKWKALCTSKNSVNRRPGTSPLTVDDNIIALVIVVSGLRYRKPDAVQLVADYRPEGYEDWFRPEPPVA